MGKNFYFKANGEGIFEEGKKIHIGKKSAGWEPLFHMNEYFTSFIELVIFRKYNQYELSIIDDLHNEYNWQKFTARFLAFDQDNAKENKEMTVRDDFGYAWERKEFS